MERRIYIILTLIYAALIFVVSSIQSFPSSIETSMNDKSLHVIEYSILGFLTLGCFKKRNLLPILIVAFVISALYGLSDEIHQYYVPGRMFSYYDVLANTLGSLLGVIISYFFFKKSFKMKGFQFLYL
jgi:VanZ family protein